MWSQGLSSSPAIRRSCALRNAARPPAGPSAVPPPRFGRSASSLSTGALRYRFGGIAIVATWLLALRAELVLSPKREQERRLALS
jgi:hypothetical protein